LDDDGVDGMERDVKQVAWKIGGPRAEGWFLAIGICQPEHEMRLKQLWTQRIRQLVSKGSDFRGRRDRQRPEEGKLGRVVENLSGDDNSEDAGY
jgi:hypothetical protein